MDEETVEWILAAACFVAAAWLVFGLDASPLFAVIPIAVGVSFVYGATRRSHRRG